jgi:hypothetical protein
MEVSYREYAGKGMELIATDGSILAGNRNFLEPGGVNISQFAFSGTAATRTESLSETPRGRSVLRQDFWASAG